MCRFPWRRPQPTTVSISSTAESQPFKFPGVDHISVPVIPLLQSLQLEIPSSEYRLYKVVIADSAGNVCVSSNSFGPLPWDVTATHDAVFDPHLGDQALTGAATQFSPSTAVLLSLMPIGFSVAVPSSHLFGLVLTVTGPDPGYGPFGPFGLISGYTLGYVEHVDVCPFNLLGNSGATGAICVEWGFPSNGSLNNLPGIRYSYLKSSTFNHHHCSIVNLVHETFSFRG